MSSPGVIQPPPPTPSGGSAFPSRLWIPAVPKSPSLVWAFEGFGSPSALWTWRTAAPALACSWVFLPGNPWRLR